MASNTKDDQHASVKLYWVFCVILCVITFLEWWIFKVKDEYNISAPLMISTLGTMSLVKFVMVVGWYMHLRYDQPILKFLFISSILIGGAVSVGLIILM